MERAMRRKSTPVMSSLLVHGLMSHEGRSLPTAVQAMGGRRGGEGKGRCPGGTILSDAVPYPPSTPFEGLRTDARPGARNAPQPGAVCAAAVRVPGRGHQARDRLHAAQLPDVD